MIRALSAPLWIVAALALASCEASAPQNVQRPAEPRVQPVEGGVLAGEEGATPIAPETAADSLNQYTLGSGDRLKVTVFGQPDMSGEFEVDGSGQITLPLVGPVDAGGSSVQDFTDRLRTRLEQDFLVEPQVSVDVLNYRPFYILGEVKSPGSYAYVAGITMRQAIAISGGFTRRARTSYVTVYRDIREGRVYFDGSLETPVLPGDTVDVGRRLF